MKLSTAALLMLLACTGAEAGFNNDFDTIEVHENHDAVKNLWVIDATCTVHYTNYYTCCNDCEVCAFGFCITIPRHCCSTCSETLSTDVNCDSCSLTNDAGIFQLSGSKQIQKIDCSNLGCGSLSNPCTQSGCLTHPQSYTGTVQCWRSSYLNMTDNGLISESFTMETTGNAGPTFTFQYDNPTNVYKASTSVGSIVNRMIASDSDLSIGSDYIRYSLISGPGVSWIKRNTLFGFSDGDITVISDLSMEFSYTFEMGVTVYDRRDATMTGTLTISLLTESNYNETCVQNVKARCVTSSANCLPTGNETYRCLCESNRYYDNVTDSCNQTSGKHTNVGLIAAVASLVVFIIAFVTVSVLCVKRRRAMTTCFEHTAVEYTNVYEDLQTAYVNENAYDEIKL